MNRVYYFDILRIIAIVSVVLMHSTSPYLKDLSSSSWAIVNLIDSVVRYSVPLFVMISGALLLSKKDLLISAFIRKRFSRILLPTLLWSFLYLYIYKSFTIDLTLVTTILNGPIHYHLWFMYMLISLYIAYPLLWGYVQKASKENLIYILIAWFLIISIEPAIQKFYGLNVGIRNEVFTYYMGYFLLGYFLSQYDFSFKYSKLFYAFVTFVLIYITAYGTEYLSQNKLNLYFYGNTSPNVIAMSIAVYLFVKELSLDNLYHRYPKVYKLIMHISKASLGIYLVHPIILDKVRHTDFFTAYADSQVTQIFLSWALTVLISFLIIFIIQKTPLKMVV